MTPKINSMKITFLAENSNAYVPISPSFMPCFYCRPQCTAPFSDSQGGYSYIIYCYSDIAIDKFEIWGRYIGVSVYLNFAPKI